MLHVFQQEINILKVENKKASIEFSSDFSHRMFIIRRVLMNLIIQHIVSREYF